MCQRKPGTDNSKKLLKQSRRFVKHFRQIHLQLAANEDKQLSTCSVYTLGISLQFKKHKVYIIKKYCKVILKPPYNMYYCLLKVGS